jgi:hypothetical protein
MSFVRRCFVWFAFVALALLISGFAKAADWEGVFEGTLGGKPILVQLTVLDPVKINAYSRYSYVPTPSDLYLIPNAGMDGRNFVEAKDFSWSSSQAMEPKGITGHWQLDVKGDVATGTWRSETAGTAELAINLKRLPVNKAELSDGDNIYALTYEDAAVLRIEFGKPHKPQSFGQVQIAYVADKVLGLAYPRLLAHPDKAKLEKTNAALTQQHRDELKDYRACKDNDMDVRQTGPDAVAEFYFNVEYASPQLLSIAQVGTNHCGGAHYNQFLLATTFDLGTTTMIGGNYETDATATGFGRIFKLDSKEDRIAFEKLWRAAWLKMIKTTGEDYSQCSESEEIDGEWKANFYFTRKGLAVLENDNGYFDDPQCGASASTPAIIPWSKLKPFLKKDQTLLRTEIK